MRKNKLRTLFLLCCTIIGIASLTAQVTIGKKEEPVAGALLQLKNLDAQTAGGSNADKGLLLPRVYLTDLLPETDAEFAASIGATGEWDRAMHTGLIVYNLLEDPCFCEERIHRAPYMWDGTRWNCLLDIKVGEPEAVKTFTDSRPNDVPQTYMYRTFGEAGDWMLENLRATRLPNGDPINFGNTLSRTAPYYVYPGMDGGDGSDATYVTERPRLGYLYNFYAATYGIGAHPGNGTKNDDRCNGVNFYQVEAAGGDFEIAVGAQGICPDGWHLPSDVEFNTLERYLYHNGHLYSEYTEDEVKSWMPWLAEWEDLGLICSVSENRPTDKKVAGAQGGVMGSPCPPPGYTNTSNYKGKSYRAEEGGFDVLYTGRIGSTGKMTYYGLDGMFWVYARGTDIPQIGWGHWVEAETPTVKKRTDNITVLHSVRCKRNNT